MERLVYNDSISKPHHRSSSPAWSIIVQMQSTQDKHATNLSFRTRSSRMHLTVHPFHYLPIRPSSMNLRITISKTERRDATQFAHHLFVLATYAMMGRSFNHPRHSIIVSPNIITFDHWPWRTCGVHRFRGDGAEDEDDCDRDLTTPSERERVSATWPWQTGDTRVNE